MLLELSEHGDSGLTFVGCGEKIEGHSLDIVDPDKNFCFPENRVGEIWFSGPSVTKGYWQNAEKTKEVFNAYTNDGTGPYMRTGDLGFLNQGQLYIVGRLKDMIIIRGRNYMPHDIEYAVESSHPGVRNDCAVAFSFSHLGSESIWPLFVNWKEPM